MSTLLKHPLRRFARMLWETGGTPPKRPVEKRKVVAVFLWWRYLRAVFHVLLRGYVLASGLYFVVMAHLSASQTVFLGAVMAVTLLLSDLSQAESFGEIFGGFTLAALVQALGISLVLIASGVVMALTGGMVVWLSTDRVHADE
jgi:hypothetical protein